ncbi:hypothetical protein GBA52_014412 [Prunus armeniaca]|nr:hypothetical protein GBA52_014412 [Prunus armeniaca]
MKVDQGDQNRGAWCNFSDLVTYNWFALCCITSNMNPFGKHQLSNWDGTDHPRTDDKGIGVEEPLKFLFGRLARVIIDKNALTVYIPSNQAQDEHKVQPYARKEDQTAMKAVTRVKILHGNTSIPPACNFTHKVPAVVFSSGGFTGNVFHEFNQISIPLFITSRHFQSHLQFVITDFKCWWVSKYERILSTLSSYDCHGWSSWCWPYKCTLLTSQGMLVQVVPLALDWPSENYYGGPAIEMGLRYLEYEIKPEDNSRIIILMWNLLFSAIWDTCFQTSNIFLKGYEAARAVYVDGQNLKVNLVRFREMLIEAMEPLGGSTP